MRQENNAAAGDEYRNLAKAAPALIMNNGLMQTLVFSRTRARASQGTPHGSCAAGVGKRAGGNGQDPGFQNMMEALLRATPAEYRRATDESLLILRWIRQFAAAL